MDMKSSTGTFVKIEAAFTLRNKTIVSFGNSHMIVNLNQDGISITFIDGPRINETFAFGR